MLEKRENKVLSEEDSLHVHRSISHSRVHQGREGLSWGCVENLSAVWGEQVRGPCEAPPTGSREVKRVSPGPHRASEAAVATPPSLPLHTQQSCYNSSPRHLLCSHRLGSGHTEVHTCARKCSPPGRLGRWGQEGRAHLGKQVGFASRSHANGIPTGTQRGPVLAAPHPQSSRARLGDSGENRAA